MTLQEIRQKYPQYQGVNDADLAKALHANYYSKMPFEDFAKGVGYKPEAQTQRKSWYDPSGLARTALGQGLAMGWGDEAEALVRSKLLKQGDYETNLNKIRADVEAYKRDQPVAATVAEIGGGALPIIGSLGAGAAVRGAAKLAGRQAAKTQAAKLGANSLARNAGIGAGYGAISGAGGAEGDLGDRALGAGFGAGIGAVGGAIIPKAVAGLGHVGRGIRRQFTPESSGKIGAEEALSRGLSESNMTPAQMKARLERDAQLGVPTRVLDTGQGVVDKATGVASLPGAGRVNVINAMEPRIESARQRVAQGAHKDIGGGQSFLETDDALIKKMRDGAKNAYDKAYAHGTVNDPAILKYLDNPHIQKAYENAKRIANDEAEFAKLVGDNPQKYAIEPIYKVSPDGTVIIDRAPDVRTLDYLKRSLDEMISVEYAAGRGSLGSAMKNVKKQLVTDLDKIVPEYGAARKLYQGDLEAKEALEFGRDKLFKGEVSPEQFNKIWKEMTPAEQNLLKIGAAESMNKTLGTTKTQANAATKVFGSDYDKQKIKTLFGDEQKFADFAERMQREGDLFKHSGQVYAGSQTAPRRALADELTRNESSLGEVFGTLNDIKGLNIPGVAGRVDRQVAKSPYMQRRTEDLSNLLTIPAENKAGVNELTQRLEARTRALEKRDANYRALEDATNTAQAAYTTKSTPFGYAESLEESSEANP